MSALLAASRSSSPSVRRVSIIQALRLARSQDEAAHIIRVCIDDPAPIVVDSLLYLLYNEWGLSLDELVADRGGLSEYCVAYARGYDVTLPEIQPDFIRHVLTTDYGVIFPHAMDFHALLGQDYERAAEFLWQARNSFLVNPSRYVSQLDLFHEELLYPILVDILHWKPDRQKLVEVQLHDRIQYLVSNEQDLALFASSLHRCHRLRSSCTEAHTRLHRQLVATSPVTWRQRNALKKGLRAGYQELVDWLADNQP